ncbi:MAG: hypothetical protein VKJ86_06860 [Synechococcus sp.]|nr:hypothetical protein [Synechococcus sp.]
MVSKGYTTITMPAFFFDPRIWFLASLHCGVGVIAAFVSWRKGYSFQHWLGFGLLGGTPVLIFALGRSPHNSPPNPEKTLS